ncbi:MAG: M1 family metallopeptidase [Gemmatimonadota bacterium]|nr:M1 family metallopeptidase [Gemmatimonadota bacterium]
MPNPLSPYPLLMLLAILLPARAGAPTDTYPRQPLDVEHYRFALTLADSTDRIEGEATVRMRLLADGLTSVQLDLADASVARAGRGMRVRAVTSAGRPLAFTHHADRLAITLEAPSTNGQVVAFTVRYAGIPADGLQIKPDPHGDRAFFSDDWPDKARQWLPVIDHISDKATMEMDVVAPAHYQVISNGLRVEETDLPDDTRRTVWRESVPIAPWLYVLGVARFAVERVGEYRGIPIETWVFAKDRDAGFHDFAVPTKDVLAFYSEWIGPFSYEKLANVQSNSVAGGMEAASAIFYSAGSVTGTRSVRWRNVVIHEIAHQWFGDAVTERDWDDVWLSEGFATYFTLLFIEHAYGRDEFVAGLRSSRQTVVDFDAKDPTYRVVHDNLADMSKVTSAMTYQKGSWVLHMLRQRLGDDRFWAGIRDYYARHRDGSASTADFRRAMETASGDTLGGFFDQWLYRGGIPRVEATWRWDARRREVTISARQVQPGAPFAVGLDVAIDVRGAARVVRPLVFRDGVATLTLAAEGEPAAVTFDPDVRQLFDGRISRR